METGTVPGTPDENRYKSTTPFLKGKKMKKVKVTNKLVAGIKSSAKNSFEEETVALCESWAELKKENKRLKKYATHLDDCNLNSLIPCTSVSGKPVDCTCGFKRIQKKMNGANIRRR